MQDFVSYLGLCPSDSCEGTNPPTLQISVPAGCGCDRCIEMTGTVLKFHLGTLLTEYRRYGDGGNVVFAVT
jgi:hypothetical protein